MSIRESDCIWAPVDNSMTSDFNGAVYRVSYDPASLGRG
jgi:hypothetical protein